MADGHTGNHRSGEAGGGGCRNRALFACGGLQALLKLADPQLQLGSGLLGLLLPQAPDGGGLLFAAAQRFEDLLDLAGIWGGQHFKAGDRLAGADAGALTLPVAAFDEGLHIAIGEVSQIGRAHV